MRARSVCQLLSVFALPVAIAWSASGRSGLVASRCHGGGVSRLANHHGSARASPSPLAARMRLPTSTTARRATAVPEDDGGGDGEQVPWFSPRRISVAVVLASSFLNLLGFTMAGPITPALGEHFGLTMGASFGSLTSAYPLGMMAGLFLWPQLSDRIGRKPVMAMSLLGSGLGLAAQALLIHRNFSLAFFLASRVLTGCFAGSSPVSKAYLADLGQKDGKLTKYLALRDAASTMAFIMGPLLGGVMFDLRRRIVGITAGTSDAGLAFTIAVSAAASLLAALVVGTCVKEGPQVAMAPKPAADVESGRPAEKAAFAIESCPLGNQMWAGVATVCVVSFLFNVGDSTFHAFFSALLKNRAGMDTKTIGLMYTGLACASFSVSASVAGPFVKRCGPVAACTAGMAATGSGLLAFGLLSAGEAAISPLLATLAATVYYCGVPLYGPTVPTMLLQCVPPNRRGAVMGLDGAINTMGRVVAPLLMGDLYRRFGSSVAFGLAGSLVLLGAGTTLFRRFLVLREERGFSTKAA